MTDYRLTPEDLRTAFAEADLRRGRHLAQAGQVQDLQQREVGGALQLSGEVQGSRRTPYEVVVSLQRSKRGVLLETSCSCPVGQNCKHAAALLSAWQPEPQVAGGAKLQQFMAALKAAAPEQQIAQPDNGEPRLYFQLSSEPGSSGFAIPLVRPLLALQEDGRLHVQGELSPQRILPQHLALLGAPDLAALKELADFEPRFFQGRFWFPLTGRRGKRVLDDALAWRRLVLIGAMGEPVQAGPVRKLALSWSANSDGAQRVLADSVPSATLLETDPSTYLDPVEGVWGALELELPIAAIRALLLLPAMSPEVLTERWPQLARSYGAALPEPQHLAPQDAVAAQLTPVLRLNLSADREALLHRRQKRRLGFARQFVLVEGELVPIQAWREGIRRLQDGELRQYHASAEQLQTWQQDCIEVALEAAGARPMGNTLDDADWVINPDHDEQTLSEFCYLGVSELKRRGWRIDYTAGFPLKLMEQDAKFYGELTELQGGSYFDLELGIEIDGERIPLLPLLAAGLAAGKFTELPQHPEATVAISLPDGRPVPISVGRLKLMLAIVGEVGSGGSSRRLPRMRAALLNELDEVFSDGAIDWHGGAGLRPLAERLQGLDDLPEVLAPSNLLTTLRPYQLHGLRWLAFLRQTELAGILADDMGLGKTVQVLSHLLLELNEGRLDRPALVVAPTSVLPNWRAELERFAPDLSVLTISGGKRAIKFSEVARHNVVLTSYALLGRDSARWLEHRFHVLVLDEAQLVKNPNTLAAKAVRKIDARHRLCLTGTPLENHLGELWAQFDFLMPGFLGSRMGFNRSFRVPIERRRDREVSDRLRRRLSPFLLRRTKDQVVSELPPKSLIVKRIELDGKQRDLYETLRISLRNSVTQALGERGPERGRVQLLDALLKLRQVCCDPRLLDLEAARAVDHSAKLEQLLEMLQALIAEGRRVLVFSQFTSMLALIEQELHRRRIRYVILTGQSEDRETPVKRFQAREVPLFLISLRAGGLGLNLTAADTVIHYDPWWNPAVEDQATDRAYRIGQDKPVFVYRLIAAGTVEERIEQMKARKRELADAMFDERPVANFNTEDLLALLDPE